MAERFCKSKEPCSLWRDGRAITIKDLKEYIKDWNDVDDRNGEPYEVWIANKGGTSSRCVHVSLLNTGDILFYTEEADED